MHPITLAEIPSLHCPCIPYPQGEFVTGCADVMIGRGIDGAMIRFFYPTSLGDIKDVPTEKWTKWFLGPKHNKGIARQEAPAHLETVYSSLANAFQKNTLIPSIWESPIINSKIPVIIFSHGLAMNRSIYSTICNDLASHGFLVAAVEHRDESASATMTFTDDGKEKWMIQRNVSRSENHFEMRRKQLKKRFPNFFTQAHPSTALSSRRKFIDAMVEIRAEECSRVLDILEKLNSEEKLSNELRNSNFDLRTLKGKLDLSSPIISGQSFGGSAAMRASYLDKRFKLSIALDPWLFPIKDKVEEMAKNTTQPTLFVLMEKFQTEKNLNGLGHYFQIKRNDFYTLRKGTHLHQMDIGLLFAKFPTLLQKVIGCYEPTSSAEVPATLNNVLIKNFIFKKLGLHPGYEAACRNFFSKYESAISRNLLCKGKKMRGWDF